MTPLPASERVLGALALQPMTVTELATCLALKYRHTLNVVAELQGDGRVVLAGIRKRQQVHALATQGERHGR